MNKSLSYYLNHKYFKQFNWYFLSGMILFGAQFLAMSYISKSNTLGDFSRYTLILSVCSPIFLLFNANSRILVATNRQDYRYSTLRSLRIVSLVIAGVISTVIGLSVIGWSWLLLFLAIASYRGFDGIYEWSYGFFIHRERADRVGRSQLLRSIALIIPMVIGLSGLVDISIAQFYGGVVGLLVILYLVFDWRLLRRDLLSVETTIVPTTATGRDSTDQQKSLRSLIALGAPLGFMALADSLSVNIPKYGFEYFGLSDTVGIYTSLFVFLQTMTYLSFSIVNSTLPSLKDYVSRGVTPAVRNIVKKSNLMMLGFSFCFIVGVFLIGKWLLHTFYTPQIALSANEFFLFSFCVIPMKVSLVYSFALFCFNEFNKVLVVSLITVLLISGLCLVLIPQFSLLGGILAFGIGQLVKVTLLFFLYQRQISLLPLQTIPQ